MGITSVKILKKPKFGYYFILMASITAALVHVLSKPMLDNATDLPEINPIVMAFLIYFICGIFFTPLVKKSHSTTSLTRRDFTFMAAIGTAEVTGLITYFYGLSTSTAVNASIFSNSEIIFSLVIALLVFRERLHIKECIPFSMIIIGMMIIPIGTDLYLNNFTIGSLVTGDLLIILSGFICAIDITLCKYLGDRFDVKKTVQVISFVSAAITISLIVIFEIPMDMDLTQLPSIIFMSIIGTGMSTIFFLMGLKLIGAVRTVLLYSTTAVFGIIFSGIFLGEVITEANVVSILLVLGGIFLLRNKLAEEETSVETTVKNNHKQSRRSSKRTNSKNKIFSRNEIKKEVISYALIGAG